MSNRNVLCTLLVLIVGAVALCSLNGANGQVSENFLMYPLTPKAIPSARNPQTGQSTALAGSSGFVGSLSDDRFIKTPSFQAILSPRFSNTDYSASIRYNMPAFQHQAAPHNPLDFGKMASSENFENFNLPKDFRERYPTSCGSGSCSGGCSAKCGKGGMPIPTYAGGIPATPPGYADGNFNQVASQVYSESDHPQPSSSLPVGSMSMVSPEGNEVQPVMYNNFIYASQKSRLRNQGDHIRGDLAIVPCNPPQESAWFNVYPNVNIDLNQGALNVIAGVTNEQGRSVANLINRASGGVDTAIGGVNLANVDMTPQYSGQLSNIVSDVQYTSYP